MRQQLSPISVPGGKVDLRDIDTLLHRARSAPHQLASVGNARTSDHGKRGITAVNSWLAVKITQGVGTMWCAYAFALITLVSLPAAIRTRDPVIMVSWLSQTFLQLVLLSIIIVGQNVLAEANDHRAEADHETLELLRQINVTQLEILDRLEQNLPDNSDTTPA
jgi:hypothetical protein